MLQLLCQNRLVTLLFQLADLFLCFVVCCRLTPLRHHSLSVCTQWLLDRQEPSGNWAGLYTAHLAITALLLQGHTLASDPVRRGIDDLRSDGFLFRHEAQTDANSKHSKQGLWMQSCVSPVWDTFLMVRGLLDTAPVPPNSTDTTTNINPTAPLIPDDEVKVDTNTLITTALAWARPRQITTHPLPSSKTTLSPFKADWSIPRPLLPPGAFSFEYSNTHYPDIDDTVIGLLNYLIHDPSPSTLYSPLVIRATTWIMGMQNKTDGGWAAFDTDNDSYWLNGLPFSDMDALCDGSSPDAAGHVVEGFRVLLKVRKKVGRGDGEKMGWRGEAKGGDGFDALFARVAASCRLGISYIERAQEEFGGWFGRWASNYLFGTSNVLCGLVYFLDDDPRVSRMVQRGVAWLQSV